LIYRSLILVATRQVTASALSRSGPRFQDGPDSNLRSWLVPRRQQSEGYFSNSIAAVGVAVGVDLWFIE